MSIGVPAKKIWEGDEVLPKFSVICPNHDFSIILQIEQKIVEDSRMKTKYKFFTLIQSQISRFLSQNHGGF